MTDVEEDLIIGVDFLRKHQVDCDWTRGVLRLKGEEPLACCRYSLGDERIRKLCVVQRTVVPAFSQVVVDTRVIARDQDHLPDWGMVSPAVKPVQSKGILAGHALVDPKDKLIPVPVLNPGPVDVELSKNALIGHLVPVDHVIPFGDCTDEGTKGPNDESDQTTSY